MTKREQKLQQRHYDAVVFPSSGALAQAVDSVASAVQAHFAELLRVIAQPLSIPPDLFPRPGRESGRGSLPEN